MDACVTCPHPERCASLGCLARPFTRGIQPLGECKVFKPIEQNGERGSGLKYDGGKSRWTLLMQGFPKALAGLVGVLDFGAKKYEAHSWRGVENGYERYRDALYRHLNAIERGELVDPESGLPHWDHVMFNVAACSELADA